MHRQQNGQHHQQPAQPAPVGPGGDPLANPHPQKKGHQPQTRQQDRRRQEIGADQAGLGQNRPLGQFAEQKTEIEHLDHDGFWHPHLQGIDDQRRQHHVHRTGKDSCRQAEDGKGDAGKAVDPGKTDPDPFGIEIEHQHGRQNGAERLRGDGKQQPGTDETPDHAVDGQWPVDRDTAPPPAALEDIGHVDHHGREHQKQNCRSNVGDQGQKRRGDHGETDADGAVNQGGERDDAGMGEPGDEQSGVYRGHWRLSIWKVNTDPDHSAGKGTISWIGNPVERFWLCPQKIKWRRIPGWGSRRPTRVYPPLYEHGRKLPSRR
ncbi:hypothetical protein DSCA_55000 [Desulfosarcina alkanivorans]|uniref:Uncharacterized protein n=1 Tax=Desulfosarcina alkanivorans TaxID=571177 RepID=A0A5K7YTC9_9BACT|nr:hypothetical protein DSCA_55000 [Desulfosarcina alkanivorans]